MVSEPAVTLAVNFWSVTVSGNWRVTFRFEGDHVGDADLIDYHLEE